LVLGTPRADAESTHVLCRHLDEKDPDFMRRVQRRIERIARAHRIHSLCYVAGTQAARSRSTMPLLGSLLTLLEAGSSLTLVGPSSDEPSVCEWMDTLAARCTRDVALRAELYTRGAERAVLARCSRAASRQPLSPSAAPPRAGLQTAAPGRWFPRDVQAPFTTPDTGRPHAG
jgi:hypothetical protein